MVGMFTSVSVGNAPADWSMLGILNLLSSIIRNLSRLFRLNPSLVRLDVAAACVVACTTSAHVGFAPFVWESYTIIMRIYSCSYAALFASTKLMFPLM